MGFEKKGILCLEFIYVKHKKTKFTHINLQHFWVNYMSHLLFKKYGSAANFQLLEADPLKVPLQFSNTQVHLHAQFKCMEI